MHLPTPPRLPQVKYKEAQRYREVAAAQAAARPAQAAADRLFRRVTARPGGEAGGPPALGPLRLLRRRRSLLHVPPGCLKRSCVPVHCRAVWSWPLPASQRHVASHG